MKFLMNGIQDVIEVLMRSGARRATKYLRPEAVISACRPLFNGRVEDGRDTRTTIVVKLGRPNFDERKFIKTCQKAGEPFPVRKIQLKFPAKKPGR